MTVYMCEPWLEGVLCDAYDAWSEPADHGNTWLAVKGEREELGLFAEYRGVQSCPEKMEKVIRSVCAKLFQEIYREVYTASLGQDRGRADKIYGFLIQAFRHGPSTLDMSQLPACYDIFGLCWNVYNENHLLMELLHFSETLGDMLVSRIDPKNDTITLLAPHFMDRPPEESWVVYDENHKRATVHPVGHPWFLVNHPLKPEQGSSDRGWSHWLKGWADKKAYEDIWCMFCDAIVIREHHNPVCQRTHLSLRSRPYMTEFQKQMRQKAQWFSDGPAGDMLWKTCMRNMCGKHVWKTPEASIENNLGCPL